MGRPKQSADRTRLDQSRIDERNSIPPQIQKATAESEVPNPTEESLEKAEVRRALSNLADAVRKGHLDEIMNHYADDVVAFDLWPPLQIRGIQAYRALWERTLINFFKFPVEWDYEDMELHVSGDVAFGHSIIVNRGATQNDGKAFEARLRNTVFLQKIEGQWKIKHESRSVPLEEKSGLPLMNLEDPEEIH